MNDLLLNLILTLDASFRVCTPLIFASMAGLFAERSGVVDIGLEGKLLMSAFIAASAATVFGSPWIGLLFAIFASCILAMIHGLASITFKGNQIVSGVAINILASGLTMILTLAWFKSGGITPTLQGDERFLSITLPGVDIIDHIPILGVIYRELISGHNILVYLIVRKNIKIKNWNFSYFFDNFVIIFIFSYRDMSIAIFGNECIIELIFSLVSICSLLNLLACSEISLDLSNLLLSFFCEIDFFSCSNFSIF